MTATGPPPPPPAPDPPLLPQPPAVALVGALDLVTRGRLRLIDQADTRLGPLGGAEHVLGVAAWTGPVAAFCGFYVPPATGAADDAARRVAAAAAWGVERLRVQGLTGADDARILLVALGPLGGRPVLPPTPGVRVGLLALDPTTGEVDTVAAAPAGLPGARDVSGWWRRAQNPVQVPTLAAVDLAERETVRGGIVAPTRQAMRTEPRMTVGIIAALGLVFLVEQLSRGSFHTVFGTTDYGALYDGLGALINVGPESHDWWRYVTSALVHDVGGRGGIGILHIAGNCLGLWFLGRPIEQLYGRLVLLGTFLITAIGGGVFWTLCAAAGIAGPGIGYGASGGVFGLMGLILMIGRVQGRSLPPGVSTSLRQYATGLLVYNAIFLVAFGGGLGINNWAHAGGLLTGVGLGLVLPPRAEVGGRRLHPVERALLIAVPVAAAVAVVVGGIHLADAISHATTVTGGAA